MARDAKLLHEVREEALRALQEGLPWQDVPDSPTARYYTPWRRFEEALRGAGEPVYEDPGAPRGWLRAAGPCGEAREPPVLGLLARPRESRLLAHHYARLSPEATSYIEARGEQRVALCKPVGGWASQHLVIRAPSGVRAGLSLYLPRDAAGTTVLEVFVEPGARLRLGLVSHPSSGVAQAVVLRLRVAERGEALVEEAIRGALASRLDTVAVVAGEEGRLFLRGLGVAPGRSHVDIVSDSIQDAVATEARLEAAAVALDAGHAVARGTARITPRGRRARSSLVVEAMSLGDAAKAYTAPMMLVETGDVEEASHRAAQYSSPEELLFYLRSRGLSAEEAWGLVLAGKLAYTMRESGEELRRLAAEALGVRSLLAA